MGAVHGSARRRRLQAEPCWRGKSSGRPACHAILKLTHPRCRPDAGFGGSDGVRSVAGPRRAGHRRGDGRLAEQLAFFAKPKLLIIDELGYLPLERASAHVFFQLVTRRYERGNILLTTNQPVTEWGRVFGDEMIAAAVLDRLFHHSHTLVVTGEAEPRACARRPPTV